MKKPTPLLPFILQKIGYVVFFVLYKIFMRVEIKGLGNLETETGPFIFAFNHTHELDSTAIPLALPFWSRHFPLFFVSAPKERYKTFGWRSFLYGGKFFNALGAYAVLSGQQNYAYALQTHEELLKKGYSVGIFPEGKRTPDGHIGPARGGLGYLIDVSGVPVVPVAISGFLGISYMDFFLGKRKLVITIGKPMRIVVSEPHTKEAYVEAGNQVMREIGKMMK